VSPRCPGGAARTVGAVRVPVGGPVGCRAGRGAAGAGSAGFPVEARRAGLIAEADRRGLAAGKGTVRPPLADRHVGGPGGGVPQPPDGGPPRSGRCRRPGPPSPPARCPNRRVRLLAEAHRLAPSSSPGTSPAWWLRRPRRLRSACRRCWATGGAKPTPGRRGRPRSAVRQRALHLSPAWSGMVHVDGDLDPEAAASSWPRCVPCPSPPPQTPGDARSPSSVGPMPWWRFAAPPRRRTPPPCETATSEPDRPRQVLQAGAGVVTWKAGVGVDAVRRLACDATVSTVTIDDYSRPVAAGPARRVVPPPLRRALDLRDRAAPTRLRCTARWCDAHHVTTGLTAAPPPWPTCGCLSKAPPRRPRAPAYPQRK